jgi:hypothetical protein
MKRRTAKRALLLLIVASDLLLGGSWYLGGRLLPRLQGSLPRLSTAATLLLWEKVPQFGDLLGLTEPGQTQPQPAVVPSLPLPCPPRGKTAEELRIEGLIDATFQEYFRDYLIGGRLLTVRMPFALNGEREDIRGYSQDFLLDGKGTPARLWPYIDAVLASRGFASYVARLGSPGRQVVAFSLPHRAYRVSASEPLLEALEQDSYPGTPTRIFVRRNGEQVSEADVYNYLYAIARVGVDCSGFTYHIVEEVARAYGIELDQVLGGMLRADPREVRGRIGLWFLDPAHGYTERVDDRIELLRPADLILFRGSDGSFKHSAVIQSIDLENGIIRYLQSTDWATEIERGVHRSTIRFDPSRLAESLEHYSVRWLQQVRPPFAGEREPRNWRTDRDRYLWYPEAGGSRVVRLRLLASALVAAEPRFYTARFPEKGAGPEQEPSASWRLAAPWLSRSP